MLSSHFIFQFFSQEKKTPHPWPWCSLNSWVKGNYQAILCDSCCTLTWASRYKVGRPSIVDDLWGIGAQHGLLPGECYRACAGGNDSILLKSFLYTDKKHGSTRLKDGWLFPWITPTEAHVTPSWHSREQMDDERRDSQVCKRTKIWI